MTNTKPLVSVIMPVNKCPAKFFEQSVESILGQTLQDLELLIIFDQSGCAKDLSQALEKYSTDQRLKVVVNKGSGFVDALNTGVSLSRGKYIARLDADDLSLPNRFEVQVASLEKLKADFVAGWAYVIDEHSSVIGTLKPPTDPRLIRKRLLLHNPFLHSAVLFKRSLFKKSGLYNQALFGAEDYDLWVRFISKGFVCINLPCFLIKLRETSHSVLRGRKWKGTRISYAKVKCLAVLKHGFSDPLSIGLCFLSPFTLLLTPATVLSLKSGTGWIKKDSKMEA